MTKRDRNIRGLRDSAAVPALLAALAAGLCAAAPALAADAILSGVVKDAAGAAMGGVTVTAKAAGSTISTSVYTDAQGAYFFPALPAGAYRVRAQAMTFESAQANVAGDGKSSADFTLKPTKDFIAQLPGDVLLAAMPQQTPGDARLHRVLRANCTGCHTISYVLQHRFDEEGWNKILNMMKQVNVFGLRVERAPLAAIDYNQKELAAYLTRARGPGPTSMNFDNMRPRPSGEAARVVFREYDVPVNPEAGLPDKTASNDGSDWALGTPSGIGNTVHDAWLDRDSNLWFTSNAPQHVSSVARIDTKTGVIKNFRLPGPGGFSAPTHGMTVDPKGIVWFNVNVGKGSLGRIDPKTEKIDVFTPPDGMMPTGGATTVDYDGKGKIWSSAPEGALRFDPDTEKFTEFKSETFRTPNGNGVTYGLAADRDGNGWWAQMAIDVIGRGDAATGKSSGVNLLPIKSELDLLSPEARAFYDKAVAPDFNAPVPWQHGPRRMGTDKNADILYVAASWGGHLVRIDTKTNATTTIPLPNPKATLPYHVHVDNSGAAWTNLWMTDQVARYNPAEGKWTLFDLPVRGSEARYVSARDDAAGQQIVLPYFRANKVAVMSFRSEADLAAARAASR